MADINSFIDVQNLTYCGQEMQDIFSKDIYSLPLDYVTMMDGVKGKVKLHDGSMTDLFQAYTCPFTPEGEVVLGEFYMEPVALKVNLEDCFDKFWNSYLVAQTQISLQGGIPQTFADWFFAEYRKKAEKEYQEIFWNGVQGAQTGKAYLGVTDGVLAQVETALDGAQSSNLISGSAFTVANITTQVEAAVMQAIESAAEAGVDTESMKIMMNHSDVRLLEVALGKDCSCNNANQIFNNYARNNGRIWIMGFEVIETEQERNTILIGNPKNLVLGFDTFDSHLEWKLIDMRNTTGDNAFRIIAITNIAVGVIFPELFVLSKV